MKQIFDFVSSNRELIESAVGLFCVYGMTGLVWFVIKYFG